MANFAVIIDRLSQTLVPTCCILAAWLLQYQYTCVYIIYIYMYIYRERDRDREIERGRERETTRE